MGAGGCTSSACFLYCEYKSMVRSMTEEKFDAELRLAAVSDCETTDGLAIGRCASDLCTLWVGDSDSYRV